MKTIQVPDAHVSAVEAFLKLLIDERALYLEMRNLRKRGEPYSAKENKRMLRIVNDMEMCEAKFSELFARNDFFKGTRMASLRIIKLLESRLNKKKSNKKK